MSKQKQKNSAFCIGHSAVKNKSGASLIFVLAVMFLLLAIGTSVLVAAGAGRGAMARQADHNQIRLLDESVQRNIMHSLQNPVEEESLGAQIILAMYQAGIVNGELRLVDNADDSGNLGIYFDNGFDITNSAINRIWVSGITLELIEQDVQISPAIPPIYEWNLNDDGTPIEDAPVVVSSRIPRTAIVSMKLAVIVEIQTWDDRTIISRTEYVFEGAENGFVDGNIHDCEYPLCFGEVGCGDEIFAEMTLIDGGGTWEVVSRGMMIHGREPD